MPINYQDIQYRGDLLDVKELYETYRVENFIDTVEISEKQNDIYSHREKLIKNGIRLTNQLSPRIFNIYRYVYEKLDIDTEIEIYCLPDEQVNAFALVENKESGVYSLMGITAGALEKLDDIELIPIIGHELGHFLFGNFRLNLLYNFDENSRSKTVLPLLGESLFLNWQKKEEISADRVGLIACGNFNAAARALIKTTFGISEKNLNLDIDSLLKQIDEIKGHPELVNERFFSHPRLPIRLKALELFSRSDKANRNGFCVVGEKLTDDELENSIDDLMLFTRNYPYKPIDLAVMKVLALSGTLTILADKEVNNEEIRELIQILYQFTDEPEKEIVFNIKEIENMIPEFVGIINQKGEYQHKIFILSRLVDVALSDGALHISEGRAIMEIAKLMNIPEGTARDIIIGGAQSFGFRTDAKLTKITEALKKNLQYAL